MYFVKFLRKFAENLLKNTYNADEMRSALDAARDIVNHAMVNADANQPYSSTSRSDVIQFFMRILKIDLFGSDLTRILFSETRDLQSWHRDLIQYFPITYGYIVKRRLNMPVGDNTIVSVPWCMKRYGEAMRHLACNDFDYRKDNYTSYFFPELKLIKVFNGRHHLVLAKLKEQGALDVDVYPLTLCFPYFKTDGAYWIDEMANTKKPVREIRFAILYELARDLWKENNKKS